MKPNFKEQYENIKNLTKQVEEMTRLQNEAYSNLPPDVYEKVKEQHLDMNSLIREFKNGNTQALNKLVDKYIKKK